jgi:mono/diheme cytochrome c family protein
LAIVLGMMLIAFVGCARAPVPDYVLSESTLALPERHQRQIERGLTQLFGTPVAPRLMTIAEAAADAPTEEQASEVASDESGEAAADSPEEAAAANELGDVDFGVALRDQVDPARLRNGATVYRARCAGCHGVSGDGGGDAAAYLLPRPRDYRRGIYKFTSTPYGMKPARSDLVRTLRRGAKGTSMPDFRWLSEEDMNDVIDYIILLSQRGEVEFSLNLVAADYAEDEDLDPADFVDALQTVQQSWSQAEGEVVLPVSAEPLYDDESIAKGREAFLSRGCSKCHGEDGKGQTEWLSHEFLAAQEAAPESQRIQINYDAWGHPAPAADLTARMLHGGRRPLDIYRRIYTGINGTPMPAFGEALAEEPDTIWHMVHYVLSIVEGRSLTAAPAEASGQQPSTNTAAGEDGKSQTGES